VHASWHPNFTSTAPYICLNASVCAITCRAKKKGFNRRSLYCLCLNPPFLKGMMFVCRFLCWLLPIDTNVLLTPQVFSEFPSSFVHDLGDDGNYDDGEENNNKMVATHPKRKRNCMVWGRRSSTSGAARLFGNSSRPKQIQRVRRVMRPFLTSKSMNGVIVWGHSGG